MTKHKEAKKGQFFLSYQSSYRNWHQAISVFYKYPAETNIHRLLKCENAGNLTNFTG